MTNANKEWRNGMITDWEYLQSMITGLYELTAKLALDNCDSRKPALVYQVMELEKKIGAIYRDLDRITKA